MNNLILHNNNCFFYGGQRDIVQTMQSLIVEQIALGMSDDTPLRQTEIEGD